MISCVSFLVSIREVPDPTDCHEVIGGNSLFGRWALTGVGYPLEPVGTGNFSEIEAL